MPLAEGRPGSLLANESRDVLNSSSPGVGALTRQLPPTPAPATNSDRDELQISSLDGHDLPSPALSPIANDEPSPDGMNSDDQGSPDDAHDDSDQSDDLIGHSRRSKKRHGALLQSDDDSGDNEDEKSKQPHADEDEDEDEAEDGHGRRNRHRSSSADNLADTTIVEHAPRKSTSSSSAKKSRAKASSTAPPSKKSAVKVTALLDWWVFFSSSGVRIRGYIPDTTRQQLGPGTSSTMMRTTIIVKRVESRLVMSKSGSQYKLTGNFVEEECRQAGVDDRLIDAFARCNNGKGGFPSNWRTVCDDSIAQARVEAHRRRLLDQTAATTAKPKPDTKTKGAKQPPPTKTPKSPAKSTKASAAAPRRSSASVTKAKTASSKTPATPETPTRDARTHQSASSTNRSARNTPSTPAQEARDELAISTSRRSGRIRFKPLNYWASEEEDILLQTQEAVRHFAELRKRDEQAQKSEQRRLAAEALGTSPKLKAPRSKLAESGSNKTKRNRKADSGISEYEAAREKNIAANKRALSELGLVGAAKAARHKNADQQDDVLLDSLLGDADSPAPEASTGSKGKRLQASPPVARAKAPKLESPPSPSLADDEPPPVAAMSEHSESTRVSGVDLPELGSRVEDGASEDESEAVPEDQTAQHTRRSTRLKRKEVLARARAVAATRAQAARVEDTTQPSEEEESDVWTQKEEAALRRAMREHQRLNTRPGASRKPDLWTFVAQRVGTRSARECCAHHLAVKGEEDASHALRVEVPKEPIDKTEVMQGLLGSKPNTLKRREHVRAAAALRNQDYEDDALADEPVRRRGRLNTADVPTFATPQAPARRRARLPSSDADDDFDEPPLLQPASPKPEDTPGLLHQPVRRAQADRIINRQKRRR
ncbi:uncharacterized protein MONBRDRAFT_33299 [Monosiga brevicollis MX1]|uniref:Myb-like domain-containing protein n=1 Tax=Monosiga brevicollis TaxID=81824 RepID=A9V4M1_MONBE|nr:uncharacterized protein MONBRDRAFT_33299 [Monosiga brevicollis MX1]EDQ87395.1 predicted protein [Monosiga brevicollis MX1]|eukprot:XP_001747655.1 hypothetical protein [Monosiga brevicollis MX1]